MTSTGRLLTWEEATTVLCKMLLFCLNIQTPPSGGMR
eukprot:CAMPEP_0172902454 /NCGR_PEP_ID=MMETSP1075-20121228/168437_1 /TAXON_ID=2916 /ORGANISM="Ceratium fusus, Strain PA161109" /LENGTH=36 /DNA_ID= /DNA_START= /DNA_END= /DNA_ORIENTATION=